MTLTGLRYVVAVARQGHGRVLRSARAIAVNIEIMRTFVKLRSLLESNKELAKKLATLEAKYDDQFTIVFEAIRELMAPPPATKKRGIGFIQD